MADLTARATWSSDTTALQRDITRTEQRFDRFGKKMRTTFDRAGKSIDRGSTAILSGSRGLITGAAIGMAGKKVVEFDGKLARLAIQANISKEEMFALKDELYAVGKATNQYPTDLLAGIDAIVQRTGNFKYAVGSLKDMGIVASATGASMADIGATASNLQEKMGIAKDEVLSIFDILSAQGKVGAFTIQDMSTQFEKLLSAAMRFEIKGIEGMRSFGAFLQIAKRGAGSTEQATTSVERTIADLLAKHKQIRRLTGFSIIDPEKSKVAGRSVMKDFDLVMKEIIARTEGDEIKLAKIFGEVSIRAVSQLAKSYIKFGGFSEFDDLASKGGDGAAIMKDFAFWADTSAAKFREFNIEIKKFTENLEGPIKLLTKLLDLLNAHPNITQGGLMALMGLAGGAMAIKGAKGAYGMFKAIKGLIPGQAAKTILDPGLYGPPAKTGLKALFSRGPQGLLGAGKGLSWLTKGITLAGAGLGTTATAAAGAGLTAFALTAGLDKLLGYPMREEREKFGAWLYDATHKPPEVTNNIQIQIDPDRRATVATDNMQARSILEVKRGSFR